MKRQRSNYFKLGLTLFLAAAAAILFYTFLFNGETLKESVQKFIRTASPILWGLFLAYFLWYVIRWVQKYFDRWLKIREARKKRKVSRMLSIAVGVLFLIVLIALLLIFILPALWSALTTFINNLSDYEERVQSYLNVLLQKSPTLRRIIGESTEALFDKISDFVSNGIQANLSKFISSLTTGVLKIGRGVLNFVIGIIVAVYILASKERFVYQFRKLLRAVFSESTANRISEHVARGKEIFDNFVVGKLLDSLIIGFLCFIGLSIMRMPYAVLISVLVGVTNMIPIVGPFIGAIPSAFLLLLVDPVKCLIFIIFILVLQQVDGNIIGPKILGSSIGLSAFWIIVALLIGGSLLGIVGMFFAVPVFAFIYEILTDWINEKLREKGLSPYLRPLGEEGDRPHPDDEEFHEIKRSQPGERYDRFLSFLARVCTKIRKFFRSVRRGFRKMTNRYSKKDRE